jgi:hypothetical protein
MNNAHEQVDDMDCLAQAMMDDLLSLPEDEYLAELNERKVDTKQLADRFDKVLAEALRREGKVRMAAAKAALLNASQRDVVVSLDDETKRRRYDQLTSNPGVEGFSLAARKGTAQSERDIKTSIEDLSDLGAFDEGNQK